MIKKQKSLESIIIKGSQHVDSRGTVSFINDFDMSTIKRMYTIYHPDRAMVRAWQGHRIESKYFKCIQGRFLVAVVAIDNWTTPSGNNTPKYYVLDASKTEILFIPNGYANGFKSLETDSQLLVFSNTDLDSSKNDQYRFDEHLWVDWTDI